MLKTLPSMCSAHRVAAVVGSVVELPVRYSPVTHHCLFTLAGPAPKVLELLADLTAAAPQVRAAVTRALAGARVTFAPAPRLPRVWSLQPGEAALEVTRAVPVVSAVAPAVVPEPLVRVRPAQAQLHPLAETAVSLTAVVGVETVT